ncbi:MAG: ATP-binding protein [Deltaproteobacteria bacterium]|nr:ATP-binding protein [Deltaproteobacteria bacterium]
MKRHFPFSAIVGQQTMKLGLILNAINPRIGGILIRGEKGTGKSIAVRGLAALLPEIEAVEGCFFNCDPEQPLKYCPACRERAAAGALPVIKRRGRVVELPINATEDRVVGTLDLERALKKGEKRFEPGLLARAHRGILYVDEVNLLDDHIVDILLDSAAMGTNIVEREGVSFSHAAEFILVGTMNPEEGELRPQLLDRFGLCVAISGIVGEAERIEIVKRWNDYESDPEGFYKRWEEEEKKLAAKIVAARVAVPHIPPADETLAKIARVALAVGVDGHRSDLVMMKACRTLAAFQGGAEVTEEDLLASAELALFHRVRRKPFDEIRLDMEIVRNALKDRTGSSNS